MKNASFERSLGDVECCGKPRPLLRRRIKAVAAAQATQLPAFATTTNATVATAAIALPGPVAITATFAYAFNCRFLDDQADFENFMNGLWMVSSLKFRSVKP